MLFVLSDADRQAAKKLVQHAQTFVATYQDMHRIKSGLAPAWAQDPARCMVLADVLCCVLVHEQHERGVFRHLAVAYKDEQCAGNTTPPTDLVAHLAHVLFGFRADNVCTVDLAVAFVDECSPPGVHVVQKIHANEEM